MLQCQLTEDKMGSLNEQQEASEFHKSQYWKQYESAISDKNMLCEEHSIHINKLKSNCSLLAEKSFSLLKMLESVNQESLNWKRKYEQVLSKQKAEEDHASSEIAILKSRCNAAEASLAAAKEQAQFAQEVAEAWERKYDIASREAQAAWEKAAIAQERTNKETRSREDDLRAEFFSKLAVKEKEVKEKAAKLKHAESCFMTLKYELEAAQSRSENCDAEMLYLEKETSRLREELAIANAKAELYETRARLAKEKMLSLEKETSRLSEDLEIANAKAELYETRARLAEEKMLYLEKETSRLSEDLEIANAKAELYETRARLAEEKIIEVEQKYACEFKRFEEIQERCKNAENENSRSSEMLEKIHAEAINAEIEARRPIEMVQKIWSEAMDLILPSQAQVRASSTSSSITYCQARARFGLSKLKLG